MSVRPNSVYEFNLPDFFTLYHCLKRRSSATSFALMDSFIVIVIDPGIQISLQFFDSLVDFFAERDLIEFLQDCFMEPSQIPLVCGDFALVLVCSISLCCEPLVWITGS